MSVNRVILVGRLGKNPEMRRTPEGTPVANCSIVTSEKWGGPGREKKERTEWHSIVAFGALAEVCSKHLQKGTEVYIEGKLETREWTDRDGVKRRATKVRAVYIEPLNNKKEEEK